MQQDQSNNNSAGHTGNEATPDDHREEKSGTPSDQLLWRPVIQPYLKTLATKISDQDPQGHSISIPIGRFNILVSPLDQELVLKDPIEQSLDHAHHELIRDAMGVEILLAVSQRKYEKAGANEKSRARNRIEKALDFGYRLSHMMTVELRQLRNDGLTDQATEVQDARRRLTAIINEIEGILPKVVTPPPHKPATEPRQAEPQRFVYQWDSSRSGPEQDILQDETATPHTQPPTEAKGLGRQRLVLAIVVGLFGVVLIHLWLNRARQLQDFSPEDFPEVPGIEQVINRSPVILIIVSDNEWASADRFDKEFAVTSVGKTVGPAGYKRAEFRSAISPRLATWNGDNDIIVEK